MLLSHFSYVQLRAPLSMETLQVKNTGLGYHTLFQGIFLTQESNPGLLHCRQIFYRLSHQGIPPTYLTPNEC